MGVVHGDDIPRSLVDAVRNSQRKRCEIREQMLSAGPKDASEIIMLNRRVQWTEAGIRTSPDPRHVKDIIEELGLEGAKPADTPMIVSQSSKKDSDSRVLSMRDATLYRRLVAKLNYLAMDRPDIRYAASTMGSQASSPKDADMVRLKRVGRFLIGRPITRTHYRWGVRSDRIMAYTDSDWAANREDRRSVSGGMLVHSGGLFEILVKKAEGGVAFVVGERAIRCGINWSGGTRSPKWTQRLREQHACDDRKRQPGRGGQHRTSGTRVGEARVGRLDVVKIPTERNLADLLTKPLPFSRIEELCRLVGVECDHGT